MILKNLNNNNNIKKCWVLVVRVSSTRLGLGVRDLGRFVWEYREASGHANEGGDNLGPGVIGCCWQVYGVQRQCCA